MVCHVDVSSGSHQGADNGQVAENTIIINYYLLLDIIIMIIITMCPAPA